MPVTYHPIYPLFIHHAMLDTVISLSMSLPVLVRILRIIVNLQTKPIGGDILHLTLYFSSSRKVGGLKKRTPLQLSYVLFNKSYFPPLILFSIFQNDRYSTWFTNAYLSIGEAWVYLFSVVVNAVNLFMQVFFTIMYSDLEVRPCCKGANFFSAITSIRSTYATS